jgi:hypothetical protein
LTSHGLRCCECTRDERWHRHHKHGPMWAQEWRSVWTSTWQQSRTISREGRIPVSGGEDSQSQAAAQVFCQSTQCQPKHVTERLESPTPHREIIVPCGTPRHNLLSSLISNTGRETRTCHIHDHHSIDLPSTPGLLQPPSFDRPTGHSVIAAHGRPTTAFALAHPAAH